MIMKKIYGVVALVAMLMGATLLLERTVKVAAAAPTGIKNVVLVRGAFADGSGWEPEPRKTLSPSVTSISTWTTAVWKRSRQSRIPALSPSRTTY
jgi:hypothetical protein